MYCEDNGKSLFQICVCPSNVCCSHSCTYSASLYHFCLNGCYLFNIITFDPVPMGNFGGTGEIYRKEFLLSSVLHYFFVDSFSSHDVLLVMHMVLIILRTNCEISALMKRLSSVKKSLLWVWKNVL